MPEAWCQVIRILMTYKKQNPRHQCRGFIRKSYSSVLAALGDEVKRKTLEGIAILLFKDFEHLLIDLVHDDLLVVTARKKRFFHFGNCLTTTAALDCIDHLL